MQIADLQNGLMSPNPFTTQYTKTSARESEVTRAPVRLLTVWYEALLCAYELIPE